MGPLSRAHSKAPESRRLSFDREPCLPSLCNVDPSEEQLPGYGRRSDENCIRLVRLAEAGPHATVRRLNGDTLLSVADFNADRGFLRRSVREIKPSRQHEPMRKKSVALYWFLEERCPPPSECSYHGFKRFAARSEGIY